jgi:four helix bundle protein
MKKEQKKVTSHKSKVNDYRDLIIWQKSVLLSKKIYEITKEFPYEERNVLVPQIRRAVISISSNIAEGYGRMSTKSFSNFLKISLGSLYEVESQLIISVEMNYIKCSLEELLSLINEIKKMIYSMIHKIK